MPSDTISSADTIPYVSGRTYIICVKGGNLTIKRRAGDDTWQEVDGSPVLDGTERRVNTITFNGELQFTPSATLTYDFGPLQD